MNHIFISLHLDLSHEAPEGPGWYIQAVSDDQPMIPPLGIPPEAALELSGAFLSALQRSDGEIPQVLPQQIVESGNRLIRQRLEEQLRFAEEQAARVGQLRRKLAMAPPLSPRQEPPHVQ